MNDDLAVGLWLSISEIARLKGKSRQAVAKRVAALVADGLLDTRPGENGTKLVNLAQFDRAVGDTGDAFRERAAETRREIDSNDAPAAPALRDHQARAAQYAADLKFLELEEKLGRLVPVSEVKEAGVKLGETVVRTIERLPTFAEALSSAAVKDGVQGVRGTLKDIARQLRSEIADSMGVIVAAAEPSTIEPSRS
jgi:DNA-binding IscR family transcriptional regulator